jgi:SAM-dependent methyltransferase
MPPLCYRLEMAAHPPQSGQLHQSAPGILGRRTLQRDHRHLAKLLGPGLSVLDVGCGTGAITAGIAQAVGQDGLVVGLDRDAGLLEIARQQHGAVSNLRFEEGDAAIMNFAAPFDVVTAARTLQWVAEPGNAVMKMRQATKHSGLVVVLDYNHAQNDWKPKPPAEFMFFYEAFLRWREKNGWDNEMADHLPELFRAAGILHVQSHWQDEVVERGDPEFEGSTAIWGDVIGTIGERLTQAGVLTAGQLREASECYAPWVQKSLIRQTLVLRTVVGQVP